ncbi:MAG: TerD family protein [Alphaproteobacteria bacterium]|nr:TerD family protein [Alphaproteobacteria bacterium]NCQ88624.1 TerD family protein [Alphaproteobacteria bacterium]NCT06167.1 TerD family protein [Alphaproteobacteria bacterium]
MDDDLNPSLNELDDRYDMTPEEQAQLEEEKLFAVAQVGPKNKISRGDEINITHKDPTMRQVLIGLGWDMKKFEAEPLDLDASVFLLNIHDKTRIDEDFIFYNNSQGGDNSVRHLGDNRTGAGDGDDEQILIDLNTIPLDVATIIFVLSIYDEEYQNPDFSMVKNVYFRVVNQDRDHELFRYELEEELNGNAGLIIARMERIGGEWLFRAIGETVEGGLSQIARNYDIIVAEDVVR